MQKHKHLSREQERRLITEYKNNPNPLVKRRIEDFILSANHNFIYGIAKKHTKSGLELSDLIAEGYRGALHALREFDASKAGKFKFITYASYWMRHYIGEATYSNATMRVPVARAKRIQTALARGGASVDDFATELDKSAIIALFGSIDNVTDSDGESVDVFRTIKSDCDVEGDFEREMIKRKVVSVAKEVLSKLQYDIIVSTFMIDDALEGEHLKDIAKRTKFTVEYIRRQNQIAIKTLKRDPRLSDLFEEIVEKDYYSELRSRRN